VGGRKRRKERERNRHHQTEPLSLYPITIASGCKVTQLCLLCLRKLQLSNLNRRYLVHSLLTRVVHLKNLPSPLLSYFQATRAHTNNLSSVDEESPTSHHFPSKQFVVVFFLSSSPYSLFQRENNSPKKLSFHFRTQILLSIPQVPGNLYYPPQPHSLTSTFQEHMFVFSPPSLFPSRALKINLTRMKYGLGITSTSVFSLWNEMSIPLDHTTTLEWN